MAVVTELEQKIIDLMIAASAFNSVVVFVRGVAPGSIPIAYSPLAEVFITSEAEGEHDTQVHRYRYSGTIAFSAQLLDVIQPVARVATIASHDAVVALANAAVLLLNGTQTLGSFVSLDGKERVQRVDVSSPRYNIAESRARPDNLENLAHVGFTLHTQRQLW